MNHSTHQREEALYAQGLQLTSPSEREAFLIKACADDPALLGKVRELLACEAEAVAQQFLPTVITSSDRPPGSDFREAEREGERIGRYKLLQQIGEGGFGVVWMAEQMEPVSRKVALKIIKLGMDTKEVIARFESERQALAMMDHPNIAKVFDAGATERGRPYFVMELVKGIPITQYCDEAGLGTRERLALFSDVCSAINHAHQKGIIHRDIKPSNVMITLYADRPVVKVIDFGIVKATQGKLTDKTLFTRFEQFIGTPVYMSPEQAALSAVDIDTRSDIYALGILLYELLTGKPPFDAQTLASAGYDEMRRIIREVEPPKPSSRLSTVAGEERTIIAKARHIEPEKLSRLVEPDLDWIVMKAIEKDRTRRYETANGLATDIKHFLADEPVSATPPSAVYQFRKFARRHQAALRVAAAIAVVLVAATAISTWQAIRATDAEKNTADTLKQVSAERDAKEQARQEAEAIATFLGEVFQSPNPERDGRTITVAETLDKAAKNLDTDLATQPARRAKLQAALGRTYYSLGLHQQAIPLLEKVRDYELKTSGPAHISTLAAMSNLANSYFSAGRRDEALKLREEVLTLRRKVSGPEHRNTLGAMQNLALSYFSADRRDEALKLQEEALAGSRRVLGAEDPDTLAAMHNLAVSWDAAGRRDEALKMEEELLALRRKVLGPEHPDTLGVMQNLATYYSDAGRRDEALRMQEELLAFRRRVLGPEHPDTLMAMNNLANYDFDAGRRDEALQRREQVLALRRRVLGPEHPDTLMAMNNLANSYFPAGRKDEAFQLREQVLALRRKVSGPEHPDTLMAMNNLANSYSDDGRLEEALKLRGELLALRRKVLGPEHPDTLAAMYRLANSCNAAGRRGEALQLREEVLAVSRRVLGPEHADTLMAMNNLAWMLAASPDATLRDPQRAVELATQAAKLAPEKAPYAGTLGTAHYRAGDYAAAITALQDALLPREGKGAVLFRFVLAMARWQAGDRVQARRDYTQAVAAMAQEKEKPGNGGQDEQNLLFKEEAAALLGEPGTPAN